MSVNWVMLSPTDDFVRLPSEQKLYTSPSRVSITLSSQNKYPGRQPYNLSSTSGKVFLTSKRIIYIPTTPPASTSNQTPPTLLASFAAPLTHLHDSHVTTPWLGPNAWVAMVQPVPGGGIPGHHPIIQVCLTFKEGGAYEFHDRFCQLRERLAQVRELGGDVQGTNGRRGVGANGELDLEQLPAYEERQTERTQNTTQDDLIQLDASPAPAAPPSQPRPQTVSHLPAEPPPGYEETQRDSVAELFESSMNMRDA